MLEQIQLNKTFGKNEWKEIYDDKMMKLSKLQREIKERKMPVLILFEGWAASGKGKLINKLITPLDQRGVKVEVLGKETEEEKERCFFWPFWMSLPPKGKIHVLDLSWYKRFIEKQQKEKTMVPRYDEINFFEEQLVKDGMVILKFFLHISQKEQEKRLKKLKDSKELKWNVSKQDWKENLHYEEHLSQYDAMLSATDTPYAVWNIIEATDSKYALAKILTIVEESLSKILNQMDAGKENTQWVSENYNVFSSQFKAGILKEVDLSKTMDKTEYHEKIDKLQNKLAILQNELIMNKIPVIIALEGWDAAGKGGAIKRITQKLDPRLYEVVPISAPNDWEKKFPYLWRFYEKYPRAGHLTIFDRTWYGRVLVERVEGLADKSQWSRAYAEINRMEKSLLSNQYIIIKFWLQIDQEEQEKRFKERENNPDKQWKITEEDWRNRSKWKEYEEAADEMFVRTSTEYAPWNIVEANSKYYARIKILETIIHIIEKRIY